MRLTTRTLLCAMALTAVMLPGTEARAVIISWSGGTGAYGVGGNWVGGVVPATGEQAFISNGGTATLSTVQPLDLLDFRINNDTSLVIEPGGSLGSTKWSFVGKSGSAGTTGTMTMNGDLVKVFNPDVASVSSFVVGRESRGILNMNGGRIEIEGSFRIDDKGLDGGEVYLNGGTITASGFTMDNHASTDATMDITGGVMEILGDIEAYVDAMKVAGDLTGYGGAGVVMRNYDPASGVTTVWAEAVPEPSSLVLLSIAGVLLALRRRK